MCNQWFGLLIARSFTRRGFSLLEVLVTIILLVVGVMAVMKALADGMIFDSTVENRTVGVLLAQEEMETQRSLSYASVIAKPKGLDILGFPGYKSQVDVTTLSVGLKQVTVTLFWNFKGREQRFILQTLIAKLASG